MAPRRSPISLLPVVLGISLAAGILLLSGRSFLAVPRIAPPTISSMPEAQAASTPGAPATAEAPVAAAVTAAPVGAAATEAPAASAAVRTPAPTTPVPVAPVPPSIVIESPAVGSVYHSSVTLVGRVTDGAGAASARQVREVRWEIQGTERSGPVPFSATGAFRVTVPTPGLQASLTLVVRAQKKGGETSVSSVTLADAGQGPRVWIHSPDGGAPYSSSVRVTGKVEGPADAPDPIAEVEGLSWAVQDTDCRGSLGFERDGSFAFTFSTLGLRGPLAVRVEARDRNGHPGIVTLVVPDRTGGPGLRIESPADGASYGEATTFEGRAGDPVDPSGTPADVKTLSWRVIGSTRLVGSASTQKDGAFRFSVPTSGLSGTQVVELRVEDWNGRATVRTVTLRPQPAVAAAVPPTAAQLDGAPSKGGISAAAPAAEAVPPTLVIDSPAANAVYRASVTVSGKATQSPAGAADPLRTVSWSIVGTSLGGTADLGTDGTFRFTVRTTGLHGTQALAVKATTRSGLSAETVVALLDDERGLPVEIASPPDGGYYKASTLIEGSVEDASMARELRTLTWEIPGWRGFSGRAAADDSGRFRFAVPFAQVTGDIAIQITSEDMNGHLARKRLTLHDGSLKPLLTLTAPLKGDAYGSVLRVSGAVRDPYAGQPSMEGIESLAWVLSAAEFSRTSTPARGTVAAGPGGAFRFSVTTAGLSGQQDLTVTAVGRSGNRAEVTLRLSPGESDLPSLTVIPADWRITVSWEPVPFASRYDLAWMRGDGAPETGTVAQGVVSPAMVSGLEEGELYSLRVLVRFDDGSVGVSTVARAIPLTPQTLMPTVTGDYQKIRLSWKSIPGAGSYDVWRSLTADGGYARIAGAVASAAYIDAAVEFGKAYFYAISPAGPLAPMSAPSTGRSLAFPVEKLAAAGSVGVRNARRVVVNGGYAFVASGASGVRIVDISNPEKPVPVGLIETEDAWDVVVRGTYAYVADGPGGLLVVDVSSPRLPVLLGTRRTSDARAVVVAGSFAYVADGDKGLKVIDVSDARALPRVGALETVNATDVALDGTRLYVADGEGGLKILDITKPTAPIVQAAFPTSDARAVALAPGLALVADGAAGLRVVDVSDPRKPALLATVDGAPAAAVSVESGFAYVTDPASGIRVVDLEDPARPTLFTAHAMKGATGIDVKNRRAYIADGARLSVMRVQIQGRSFRVASAQTGGKAYGVSVSGGWAYVAGHATGISVVDVRDPSKVSDASLAGVFATRFALAAGVQERLAFVADGDNGVRMVDVSPAWDGAPGTEPVGVGTWRPGGTVSAVVPAGGLAFVAAGAQGVRVLDIRTPSAPAEIASVRTTNACDIVVKGQWAWVADGDGGVRLIDVSTPARPKMLSAVVSMNAKSLALSGDLLFAAGTAGVSIIDISDPPAPVVKGRYDTRAVEAIAASGANLYVAEGYRGLTVLDVSHPSRPVVVSTCEDVFAVGVAAQGDYALVADSRGLVVIRILIPEWLRQ